MTYTNPIVPGFHPDPSVCRVGEDYYLVTSSFEYFPGVPLFHSRDLVNWTKIGHCLTRRSQLELAGCGPSGGIYAPTLRFHNGRYYLITTNVSAQGNFLLYTDDLAGEWSDPVLIEAPGIDPSLLFDGERVYYTGNGADHEPPGIYGFEIDVTTGKPVGPRSQLWTGTGGAYPEGPHLYHIGDWYYLMISEGGTEHGHMLTIARCRTPLGTFEACPHNPILTNRSLRTNVKAVGHADLVQAVDGRWWAVCLAIRPYGYHECHHLGRETFLAPVVWNAEGWPVVGDQGHLSLEMTVPGDGPVQRAKTFAREDFDATTPGVDWCFLRTPTSAVSLTERPGFLTLRGTAVSLDDQDTPAFLGRRLEHQNLTIATQVEFEPDEGEEAGLTILLNHRHHYEAALTRLEGQRSVLFRRRIGSLWKVEACLPCPSGPVVLGVEASPATLKFTFQAQGQAVQALGEGETRYLSTEVGGAFTGTFAGLYATGHGKACRGPAHFDWFDYTPV